MKENTPKEKNPVLVSVGKHIKIQRMLKGWSIEKLAEEADVSVNFIGDVERGKSNPSFEIFFKIAAGLEVDPTFIFKEIKVEVYPMIEEYIKSRRLE